MHASPAAPLLDLLIILAAAVLVVPILKKLRSSPVLGYLAAGVLVGPYGFALIHDPDTLHMTAEFGVVFMLFMIGLELSLPRLWVMRNWVFGLGLLQVFVTSIVIGVVAYYLFGLSPEASLVIGGALALSSTAFVLQLLIETGDQMTRHGRTAFAILLFQDLAVLPLLVVIPLLANTGSSLVFALVEVGIVATAVLGGIIVAGRYLLQPVFRMVASVQSNELFAIATLLLVLGTGWVTDAAGMSMTLGAFIAGLLVAETAFRHQIEADIRPFRGILLSLFFVSVGTQMDLPLMVEKAPLILMLLAALLIGKALVLFGLCIAFKLSVPDATRVSLLMAQGGEFAFVAFTLASAMGVIDSNVSQVLMAVVAISLFATPFLSLLGKRVATGLGTTQPKADYLGTESDHLQGHLVIAGYGRVGRAIAKLAGRCGVPWLALDLDHARVAKARAENLPVYFADAARAEVLSSAGLGRSRGLVITLNAARASSHVLQAVRENWPEMPVFVRAHDSRHARELYQAGATATVDETAEPSLQLGGVALVNTGVAQDHVDTLVAEIREEDLLMATGPTVKSTG